MATTDLPAAVRQLLAPAAVTSMAFWDRHPDDSGQWALRYWFGTDDQLTTLRAGADGPVLKETVPGDIAYQILWYASGTAEGETL